MALKIGIVGLPNVGKSTLFNALTSAGAAAENYPFCTTEPNVGAFAVHDPRLAELARRLKPERTVAPTLDFVDIAGLVRGASEGQGMGNEFLSHIKGVDAVAHVVRCFADPKVSFHESVLGVDPARDADIVEFELIQKDLQWTEKRFEKTEKLLRTGEKAVKAEVELYRRMIEWLHQERPLLGLELSEEERVILKEMGPVTWKPMFYVANLGEESLGEPVPAAMAPLTEFATRRGRGVVPFFVRLEAEIAELDPAEREDFRRELGAPDSGIDALVRAGFAALDLIAFYTKVGPELRAWTVKRGATAPQAAGAIHTDFERGFIKAEVVSYADFLQAGSEAEARKHGLARQEGKDYRVEDGDVIHFKFNV